MINAVTTATTLDWKGWALGIMGALISGGAGAIASGTAITIVDAQDPDHFVMQGNHMIEAMAITFVISAVVSLAKYLQSHPVPDQVQAAIAAAATESNKAVIQASKAADAVANAQTVANTPSSGTPTP
jgi:hypothetical protein